MSLFFFDERVLLKPRNDRYYASLIRETHVTAASVFAVAVGSLTTEQQLELVRDLTKYLAGKGLKAILPL